MSSSELYALDALSGPFLVSRTGDAGLTERCVKVPKRSPRRLQQRCWSVLTVGRWTWKSSTSKDSVTTHLPNGLARKMDGAQAIDLDMTANLEDYLPRKVRE